MDEINAGENTLVKLMNQRSDMFQSAASRALPAASNLLGVEGTLELLEGGHMSTTAFRAVKRVLLRRLRLRTASVDKINDWTHSFDCKYSLHELELAGGTIKAPTKLKSLLVLWDFTEVTERELDLAFERGWVKRALDFHSDGQRDDASFKLSQDAGGLTGAWVVTCLNQAFVCSAR